MEKYKRSRVLYIIIAAVEYFITMLASGTFLAKLTEHLGISDSMTGIISAFASLGCFFQILSMLIFKKTKVKKGVMFFCLVYQMLFVMLYLTPFFNASSVVKQMMFLICILLAGIVQNIASVPKDVWYMSMVDKRKIGVFASNMQITSLVGGIIFSFAVGAVIDYYDAVENILPAFGICALAIFALSCVNTASLAFSQQRDDLPEREKSSLISDMKVLVKNKDLRSIILISVLWAVANYVSVPFFGTYQIKELGFSMKYVTFITVLQSVSRILVTRLWGKYADRYGCIKMARNCFFVVGLSFFINIFTAPSNGKAFFVIFSILYAIAMGGVGTAVGNMVYEIIPGGLQQNALIIKNCIAGLVGFLTTLAAGYLVSYIQANNNSIFAINIYAQQVVSLISFVVIAILVCYIVYILKKKESKGSV